MIAFAQRALIVTFPPVPLFYGGGSLWLVRKFRRAKPGRTAFLAPAHRSLPGVKFKSVRVIRTPPTLAKPWQLVHRPPPHPTGRQAVGGVR